jgi:predicted AAA+ superfamily ATPase
MKSARETLTGRIGILTLYGLSQSEKLCVSFPNELEFSLECLRERQGLVPRNDIIAMYEHFWKGGMPQVLLADAEQRQEYYSSYASTFLMRDVAEIGGVKDTFRFGKFLAVCAALVGNNANFAALSEAADISPTTAKEWLGLLEGLCIVRLLSPYANSALKRLSKTPKLYFCDTGLVAHLSLWLTRDTLMNGAASGRFFENHVVMELVKS